MSLSELKHGSQEREAQSGKTSCPTAELSVSAAETDSVPDSMKVEYTVTTGRPDNNDDEGDINVKMQTKQELTAFFYQWPVRSPKSASSKAAG